MLVFFLVVFALLALAGGLYWRWKRKIAEEIAEGAAIEWAHYQRHEPDFVKDVSEEKFREVYARVHMPRFPGYVIAIVTAFFVSLPITFAMLNLALWVAGITGVIPEPVDVADRVFIEDGHLLLFKETPPEAALYYVRDLAGFYYFFGVIASWLVIVWFFMRRFHARRPGYLRDELIRSRE